MTQTMEKPRYKSKYEHLLPHPRGSEEWEDMKIKPFTPNQMRALALSNAPFNLWDGSIRSGKTFLSIAWLVNKIQSLPEGDGMLLGQTSETIERNFLNDFMEMLGEANYHYVSGRYIDVYYWGMNKKTQRQEHKTRRLYVVGAKDRKAIGRIRGSTLMLAYIDEASLMPKIVFDELVGRLSSRFATLLATTNPDSPKHWLLKDYVEHPTAGKDWRRFKFLLDDNLALDPEYIERVKRQYRGLPARYARMILGKWALAEGLIYSLFNEARHVKTFKELPNPKDAKQLFVGGDYGAENPTTFLLIGEHMIDGALYYVVHKEFYHSGRETNQPKTTKQYADEFAKLIKGQRVKKVAIDPSAKSLQTELNQIGIKKKAGAFYNVIDANNDVQNGIQNVANIIAEGKLLVNENCVHTIEEFSLYSWNAKKQEIGEDVPDKEHDHCMDALRYAIHTIIGENWMSIRERSNR